MHSPFSTRTVVLVGILAVVLPAISRIISSPFTLILVSPLILLILSIVYLLLNVYAGWYLDIHRTPTRNYLHTAARPFAFSTPAAWQAVLTRSKWSQNTPKTLPPLYPDSHEVSDALNDIVTMAIRDFVSSWYSDISESPAFPIAVSSIIHSSLQQINERAAEIDLSALVVKRILPKVTAHIEQFRQSEVALRGAGLERRLTQSEELDLLLASRYVSKATKLHPAVENLSTTFTRQTEEMHLRQLVDKALPFILPPKERNSKALCIVVREIVTCSVLFPVVEMVADPDFWNKMIDQWVRESLLMSCLISNIKLLGWSCHTPAVSVKKDPTQQSSYHLLLDSSSPKCGMFWNPSCLVKSVEWRPRALPPGILKELQFAQMHDSSSRSCAASATPLHYLTHAALRMTSQEK
jgi:sorting nexin-25